MQGIGSWKRGEKVGASYYKRDDNWRAYGNDFYEQVHLGYFATQEEAHWQWKLDKAARIKVAFDMHLSHHIETGVNTLINQLTR
jgi:hypothetical protein